MKGLKRDFILDPNLMLYLPLWKLDGAKFMSQDARGHLCTVTGATWGSQGRTFDGSDDKIDLGDIAPLRFLYNTPFSFVAWVKPSATNIFHTVISKQADAPNYEGYICYLENTGKIVFQLVNTLTILVSVKSTNAVMTTDWQLIGVNYSGSGVASGVTMYRDGDAIAMTTATDNLASNSIATTATFQIGQRTASLPFTGQIGEVMVKNEQMTLGQYRNFREATKWRYQ